MMRTHEIYKLRKHLILEHGWSADDAGRVTTSETHDDIDHAALEHGHS